MNKEDKIKELKEGIEEMNNRIVSLETKITNLEKINSQINAENTYLEDELEKQIEDYLSLKAEKE